MDRLALLTSVPMGAGLRPAWIVEAELPQPSTYLTINLDSLPNGCVQYDTDTNTWTHNIQASTSAVIRDGADNSVRALHLESFVLASMCCLEVVRLLPLANVAQTAVTIREQRRKAAAVAWHAYWCRNRA